MSIEVLSQERFILRYVEEQVQSLRRQERNLYSSLIEFGIGELVRLQMRQLAEQEGEQELPILEQSIQLIQEKLDEWCVQRELSYDFTSYFEGVRKSLRFAAREMSELSKQLDLSRRSERVASREIITDGVMIPLEIVQVGLSNAIESLFVVPLTEEFELNVGRVSESYSVEGQWFPYQILIGPFNLLLDDDGTILIPVLEASEALIEQAREALVVLAEQLYQPSLDD